MFARKFPFLASALLVSACAAGAQSPPSPVPEPATPSQPATIYAPIPGFDKAVVDPAADPCVDFYKYACGNFSKLHPIPNDLSHFDEFQNLYEYNLQALHGLLERSSAAHPAPGSDEQKVSDYYNSCMDTAAIDRAGLRPIQPELDRIAGLKTRAELTPLIAHLTRLNAGAFLNVDAQQDYRDAAQEIAVIDQGGLGLPEKDYYLRSGDKDRELRAQYLQHLANLLKLLGDSPDKAATGAKNILALETALAKDSLGNVERRNPDAVYHPMPVTAFAAQEPSLQLPELLKATGVPPVSSLNVAAPAFFKGLNGILASTDLDTIRDYLRVRLVDSFASRLPHAFDQENFDFFGRKLTGTPEQQPRWKRCVEATDTALGEALGKVYVAQYFAGDSKQKTLAEVREIEAAMGKDLEQLDWMSPATRTRAQEKLHAVVDKIGYPDKWRDYSALEIKPGDALGNSMRARSFETAYHYSKIGKPVDKGEWIMTPPTVNAYYDPSMNTINFPAGILQPAFYDKTASEATNSGHIGAVVGHELTHGFDDEGRKFDAQGNLRDWWTPEDVKKFDERTKCLVGEYSGFTAVDDLRVNGQLTLGENTADNGGLRLALMALMAHAAAGEIHMAEKNADGYTPAQQLFMGWAQNWCSSERPEETRMLVQTDPHAPDAIRANGVVVNMPEFREAFSCKVGQPMAPAKTCRVW